MTSFVFDTGALSLLYADERLGPVVDQISSSRAEGFVPAVILAEFYYRNFRSPGREIAELWSKQVSQQLVVQEGDLELSLSAGQEKCKNNNLSLADSYALALTRRLRGILLTTDRELAKSKEINVRLLKF